MRTALLIFAFVAGLSSAYANESSSREIIGFANDGKVFAFQQFGFSDGTGAPYASHYLINVMTDQWLAGTPLSASLSETDMHSIEENASKEGGASFGEASALALTKMRSKLSDKAKEIVGPETEFQNAIQVAHNPPHEFPANPETVGFNQLGYKERLKIAKPLPDWILKLRTKEFPASENCYGQFEQQRGFSLVLTNTKSDVEITLVDDHRVPTSRGCPQGYAIEEVLVDSVSGGAFSLAVMVRYTKPGFEGPDSRLLAVTKRIEQ